MYTLASQGAIPTYASIRGFCPPSDTFVGISSSEQDTTVREVYYKKDGEEDLFFILWPTQESDDGKLKEWHNRYDNYFSPETGELIEAFLKERKQKDKIQNRFERIQFE